MSTTEQDRGLTDGDQLHETPVIGQEGSINEPISKTPANQGLNSIDNVEHTKNEKRDTQPGRAPQGLLKGKNTVSTTPQVEEPDHAQIERLGRERPAKFKSFGAELAFCYSVIASQFMSVRPTAATSLKSE